MVSLIPLVTQGPVRSGVVVVLVFVVGGTYLGTPPSGQDEEQAPYFPDDNLYLPVVPGGASTLQ